MCGSEPAHCSTHDLVDEVSRPQYLQHACTNARPCLKSCRGATYHQAVSPLPNRVDYMCLVSALLP